jgi:protein-L-isoaspartate(D-aspartate) O-methyltransferase
MSTLKHFAVFAAGWFVAVGISPRPASAQTGWQWYLAREQMVARDVVAAGVTHPRVITALRRTPRHEFVPMAERQLAYFDMALPIGEQQTISPPFVVATMTVQLDPQPTDKVLEIGTGSGYQAAILAGVVGEVYTMEIQEPLARTATRTLSRLGYKNVHVKLGDGFKGWPEHAPFDKIIVTCSPEKVPQPLVDQLREGGRMVIPLGERYHQVLYRFEKQDGKLVAQAIEPTFFVPMTGTAEEQRNILPDGKGASLVNGGFEKVGEIAGIPHGWYYVRQATLEPQDLAGHGAQMLLFRNRESGRAAQALQAVGVDGRNVHTLVASIWVRGRNLTSGQAAQEQAQATIIFFDKDRVPVGGEALGPWHGSFGWRQETAEWRVPQQARFATVIVGLSGGMGELAVDDFTLAAGNSKATANR